MVLPPAIASLVAGGQLERMDIGCTPASVFKITSVGQPTIFLKSALLTQRTNLSDEAERLNWLQGKLTVPRVLSFLVYEGWEHLLTTGLPGINGVDAGHQNPEGVVSRLAEALARLHAQSAQDCPFDEGLRVRLEQARIRLREGLVDVTDFDEERRGRTALEVWRELEAYEPIAETPVLTHGDACLPNVIFDGALVCGFVDCGRAGVADAYQDLALASRSISDTLGHQWVDPFFKAYGLDAPDGRKLGFYRLLDEFF